MQQRIYFAGTQLEIGHHAAPLDGMLNYTVCEPDDLIDQAQPGDVVVFYSEHFDRFRNCCRQLKERNVATLYMVDGILEWRNAWENRADEPACPFAMRPALAHKVACIGRSQARIIESWGNGGKTEIVGVPRFERLRNVEKRQPDSKDFRLLILTAKCPAFTDNQRNQVRQSLIELRDWIAETPIVNGKQIHPCWRLAGDLAQEIDVQNELSDFSGAELESVLVGVDAVIGTPSTALIESMLLDLPTAILDYTNSPQYVSAAWNVTSNSHLGNVIAELATPPESKMVFQRQILNDTVCLNANATERFAELILEMQKTAAACVAENRPLQFADKILSEVPHELQSDVGFASDRVFPDYPEFTISDLQQAQSELAHSRREIEHLHRTIDGLKAELGQAHEIFEQIHEHPIAGRVVRARQKIVDFMARIKSSKGQTASKKPPSNPITKTG